MAKTPVTPLPLSLKEKVVLEFIESFLQQKGIAPSFQEIRDHFGFASLNSVQRYLKQLQSKNYIHLPGGNQKRALMLLHSSQSIQSSLIQASQPGARMGKQQPNNNPYFSTQLQKETSPQFSAVGSPPRSSFAAESLSVPLLGRVAAGAPIEAFEHNETIDVPTHMLRNPNKSFALRVQGRSMIEDGILDGDLILVQRQEHASNGETVVAVVDNEATVKRFYFHRQTPAAEMSVEEREGPVIELRPANSTMRSMWYPPNLVEIKGVVVGLIRRYS